jgi:hypothetical protein
LIITDTGRLEVAMVTKKYKGNQKSRISEIFSRNYFECPDEVYAVTI